jgi:hypothetical protein
MNQYQDMKLTDRYVRTDGGRPVPPHSPIPKHASKRIMDERCEKVGEMPEDGSSDGVSIDNITPEAVAKRAARKEAISARHSSVKLAADYLQRFKRLWG